MRLTFAGTPDDARRRIRDVVKVLTGQAPDTSGTVRELQLRMGVTLLGKVKDSYVLKSEGGTDEMGITWPDLSPVTLGLRRKVSSDKTVVRLAKALKEAPRHRQRMIFRQLRKLEDMIEGRSPAAKRLAKVILERMRPFISRTRYNTTKRFLESRGKPNAGAFALILRDTGAMLNSLSPGTTESMSDQILETEPGRVIVGTNKHYFKYHQSALPRKKKKDGSDRLPRRQVLPDETHPMPATWWSAMVGTLASGLRSVAFWETFFGRGTA